MKPDQERVKVLLTETIALLCKNGLNFVKDIRVQGLLGITVDSSDVFIVQLNESLWLGDNDLPTLNELPVAVESSDAPKIPRRRTVLADRVSPFAAARSDDDSEQTSKEATDSLNCAKSRNDKQTAAAEMKHKLRSETCRVPVADDVLSNAPPVEIKSERLSSVDNDVVFIDDDELIDYDPPAERCYDERRQSFDESRDYTDSYSRTPACKRLKRASSSSDRLFNSSAVETSRGEPSAPGVSGTSSHIKLEIESDGLFDADERQFQGHYLTIIFNL